MVFCDNVLYVGQFIWSGIDYFGELWCWLLIVIDYGIVMCDGMLCLCSYECMSWWLEMLMVYFMCCFGECVLLVIDFGYEMVVQI